jgi:hypothetical protein
LLLPFASPRQLTSSIVIAILCIQKVLRIYDTRFRQSERRPDLYVDPNCVGIVGGVVETVLEIVGGAVKTVLEIPNHGPSAPENQMVVRDPVAAPPDNAASQYGDHRGRMNFFTESPNKTMSVIATPFRAGKHVAQHPKDFLPIIEHLQSIHKAGYVHGDIRACNTAFPETEGSGGYLIDFDFAGKAGKVVYPAGYVRNLDDGYRFGFGKKEIEKWHDWFALGKLIFEVHEFVPPGDEQLTVKYLFCLKYWTKLKTDPPKQKIDELKVLLSNLHDAGWKVNAGPVFHEWLNTTDSNNRMTKQGATGSPPKA